MAVKAKHACTHGKQYARGDGGGVGQVGVGTEHPREGGHRTYNLDSWDASTT
jgi:hypothetical protein